MLGMNAFWNSVQMLLGLGIEPRDLTFIQISQRGIIVFLVTLAAVRLRHKRSLARRTPFDAVLLVILAAVLSRAINGRQLFSRLSVEALFWCPSPIRISGILFLWIWNAGEGQR